MKTTDCLVKKSKGLVWIGINALLLTLAATTSSQAQQPISTSTPADGTEVFDTMTVGSNEIIATVTVDNEDYEDIDFVAAQAFLFIGSTEVGTAGTADYEYDTAQSTATSFITTGQAYTLQGYAGACYYVGGDDDDDDDDDDDGGLAVQALGAAPAYSAPPNGDCSGGWLGYLPLTLQTGVPSITSISPNTGTVGDANKTITITGQNLQDELDVSTVSISGSGISSSVSSPGASDATVTYSISTSASTGPRSLTMSNSFGTSNPETFTVVDPSPKVTGVSPSTWYAGNSYTVTITGTNFGTNPTVSIALPSGTIQPTTSNPSDTSVTVSFAVPADCPSGTAPVTVTSTGFNGSGFYNGNSGNSPSASDSAPEVVFTPPTPTINLLNGITNSPFAGQPISLSVSPPSNLTLASQSWSFTNPGDAVAGYNASAENGCYVPVVTASGPGVCPASSFATTQTNLGPFYFIVPGQSETVTVTVTYNLAGGSTSNPVTATQTFSAQGPTGSLQPQAYLQTGSSGTIIPSATANPATMSMGNAPQQASTVGVWFKEPVSAPTNNPGSFIWIQILNSVDYSQIPTLNSNYSPPSNALNQLDGSYPYPSNADVAASQNPPSTSPSNYSADAPARLDLGGILGEAAVSFDATMYVLWDPAIPPQGQTSCTPATVNTNTGNNPYIVTPSNCSSIPVPLGAIDWTWSACAINALAPAGSGAHTNSWFVQCGAGTQSTYENSVYPTWNSCFKSKYGGC